MIPRPRRLSERKERTSVQRRGKKLTSTYFFVWALPAENAKMGAQVGKDVSKHAAERTRIKRAAQAAYRAVAPHLSPHHILVIAKNSANKVSGKKLQADLTILFTSL